MSYLQGTIGTPLTPGATRALLLGSGELGKEVAIELQRLGIETVAVDRYPDAPAMSVSHRHHVVDMTDGAALRAVIEQERPDLIVPEVEAIATEVLADLEQQQTWPLRVVPTAHATALTMNREGIRRLAAETLGLATSPYAFVDSPEALRVAAERIGYPVVVKPIQSSSGKGQSVLHGPDDVERSWQLSQSGARGRSAGETMRVIVEGFVDFDYEITLLTVQHTAGTTFCDPIRHRQVNGDYVESWQGEPMPPALLDRARQIAGDVTSALGGWGLFGVELFIAGDEVIFSEVSPRPHDTGLVTLVSQDVSEFGLHARAILGLPVHTPLRLGGDAEPAAASMPIKVAGSGVPVFSGVDRALAVPTAQVRMFGKPRVDGERRVAVALARGETVASARERAQQIAAAIDVTLH